MRIQRVLLAALAAVLASFAFSSCVNEAPEINYVVEYTHNSDFSSIIEAIKSQSTTIAQKLDAVKTAVDEGFMTMEEASGALKDALVESLNNQNATLSDIEEAISSQNLLLEDKLDILTAAVDNQTITLEEALGLIDGSIQDQTEALEAKLDLINETIETGAADLAEASAALKDALVEALNNQTVTLEEALDAIDGSIQDQTEALEAKLDLLCETIENGVTTLEEALGAIDETIQDQTEALEAKLDLICEAIETGAANLVDALNAFEETMDEDIQSQTQAINNQTLAMTLIGNAIVRAINNGVTTLEEALEAIEEAIDDQTEALETQLEVIAGAIDDGATTIDEALEALGGVIEGAIEAGVEDITGALSDFSDALVESIGDNTEQLEAIVGKLEDLQTDLGQYSEALAGYVQDIIDAIYESHSVTPPTPDTPDTPEPRYEVVDGFLCMNQAAYDEIMAADDPQAAIQEKLAENSIDATVPSISAVTDSRMNYQNYTATVNYQEAATPVYHAFFYDYDDPEETDDKLVKKVVYYSIAFDFTVVGYGAQRPRQNTHHSLHWSVDAQNWSDPIESSSYSNSHHGTATYNVTGAQMINNDGTFASMIYFDYSAAN